MVEPNPLSTSSTGKGLYHALRWLEQRREKYREVALGAQDQETQRGEQESKPRDRVGKEDGVLGEQIGSHGRISCRLLCRVGSEEMAGRAHECCQGRDGLRAREMLRRL